MRDRSERRGYLTERELERLLMYKVTGRKPGATLTVTAETEEEALAQITGLRAKGLVYCDVFDNSDGLILTEQDLYDRISQRSAPNA